MRYILTLYFFTISVFGFDYHLKSYNMTDGVACFFGLSSKINEVNGANIINTCFIETSEGYIVIDSGPTYSYAQQAYSIMENKKKLPVKYVINTSADEVHTLGNGFYKEQGATLIGPKAYQAYEKENKIDLKDQITADTFANTRITPLDTYLDSNHKISLGGLNIEITKIIKESDRYLLVNIPDREIIFVGDMVFNNRLTPLKNNRSLLNWIDALREIEKMSWQQIISSHGIKTKHSALKNTKSYLTMLRDEVTYNVENGVSKEKSQEEIKMLSFQEDKLYDFWNTKNIAVAYDEIENMAKKQSASTPAPPVIVKKEEPKKSPVKKVKPPKVVKKKPPVKVIKSEPHISYYSFNSAMRIAKKNKKIVLIKIRSDNCPYCDELDSIMAKNNAIKKIINHNYKVVYLNNSRDELPLDIKVALTPSLAFVRPDTQKVVMVTNGIEAVGELIDILNEAVKDGRANGYLK